MQLCLLAIEIAVTVSWTHQRCGPARYLTYTISQLPLPSCEVSNSTARVQTGNESVMQELSTLSKWRPSQDPKPGSLFCPHQASPVLPAPVMGCCRATWCFLLPLNQPSGLCGQWPGPHHPSPGNWGWTAALQQPWGHPATPASGLQPLPAKTRGVALALMSLHGLLAASNGQGAMEVGWP